MAVPKLTLVAAFVACGSPQLKDHSVDLTKYVPATLEARTAREGDPRVAKVRVWVDPAVRASAQHRDEISEQVDYANQLLTPLIGVRLSVEGWSDLDATATVADALKELAEVDRGEGAHWVIAVVAPGTSASKAMVELGAASSLGKYVVVRAWSEQPETASLASALPDLKDAERKEVIAAHRRHKQTVVLLHHLAVSLGGIAEADPAWILHPTYSAKQSGFADRTKELLTIGVDHRLAEHPDDQTAHALLEAVDKSDWGGWIAASKDEATRSWRIILDAKKAGKIAADIPKAAYDHVTRVRELAKRGDTKTAIADLDNIMTAYPGNAALQQIKCEILVAAPGAKPGVEDPAARAACDRMAQLAPGDPAPHLLVGAALAKAGQSAAARAELLKAEPKIPNSATPADGWRTLVAIYSAMGSVTWTEQVIEKGKLENDPAAAKLAQTRARYGLARGSKLVSPEDEGALVSAIKDALALIYGSKYGDAHKAVDAALRRWRGAPGVLGAKCDLELREGAVAAAKRSCDSALAADPGTSWALYLSGVIDLKTAAGTASGIKKLEKAIEVDPELGQAWRTLAKAYQRANDRSALDKLAAAYQARFGTPLPR